jgi:hypothetical protein
MKEILDALNQIVNKLDKLHGISSNNKYGKKPEPKPLAGMETPEEEQLEEQLEEGKEDNEIESGLPQEQDEETESPLIGKATRSDVVPGYEHDEEEDSNPFSKNKNPKMLALEMLVAKAKK